VIVTSDELEHFTGKTDRAQKRYGSQAAERNDLGVQFPTWADGTLAIFKRHLDDGQAQKA